MKITIFRPGEPAEERELPGAGVFGYDALRALLTPLLDGGNLERVNVLHGGIYTDMFVDEIGLLKQLPRNEPATAIYRNNWLTQHPGTDPEVLPAIYGAAVLFEARVWR